MKTQLETIFSQFEHNTSFVSYKELASGHINDTYLIETSEKPYFVLQRINHGVFKDVPGLISNKVQVSDYMLEKKKDQPNVDRTVIALCKNKDRSFLL